MARSDARTWSTTFAGGRLHAKGPRGLLEVPTDTEVADALARMRQARHVNVHFLETEHAAGRLDSRLALDYLEHGRGTFRQYAKSRGVELSPGAGSTTAALKEASP